MHAYTTAAVINYSLGAPEEGIEPQRFMPNFRQPKAEELPPPTMTPDEIIDWQTRVANLAAELKVGHGPMLDEIRSKSDG